MKKEKIKNIDIDQIYPLTVFADRYEGTYSGAEYLAIQADPGEIPEEISGSDPDCACFWSSQKKKRRLKIKSDPVIYAALGKGHTVNEAIDDLKKSPYLKIY